MRQWILTGLASSLLFQPFLQTAVFASEKFETLETSSENQEVFLVEFMDLTGECIGSVRLEDKTSFSLAHYAPYLPVGWHFLEEVSDLKASSFYLDLDRSTAQSQYWVRRIAVDKNSEDLDLPFDVTKPIYLSLFKESLLFLENWQNVGKDSYDGETRIKEILASSLNALLFKTPYQGIYYQTKENVPQADLIPIYSDVSGQQIILFYKSAHDLPVISRQAMLRLYNASSGEHFYTNSQNEHTTLVNMGWKDEAIAWIAPIKSEIPIYRLYNPNEGDHHYTRDKNEYDTLCTLGWKGEGIGWYSAENSEKAIYRLYNPKAKSGTHHYTESELERNTLVEAGWKEEGIGWYGFNRMEEEVPHF